MQTRAAKMDQRLTASRGAHSLPGDGRLDSTLALARDPYGFITEQSRRLNTDVFRTRLLLKPAICMTGPEAARLFYDAQYFQRAGAQPGRVQKTLFGKTGVQQLDGPAHERRKQMFLSLMAPERVRLLEEINERAWHRYAVRWRSQREIVLYPEVCRLLTETVCEWAGIPLSKSDVAKRSEELTAQFHSARSFGPARWRARILRKRAEHWAEQIIGRVRRLELIAPESSAALVIARHRDLNGKQLDARTAAAELLNVLRPTVAVAVLIAFVAHALNQNGECRAKLGNGQPGYDEMFAQEVRRFYPFFPAVMARTLQDFEWNGFFFPARTRAMLDLYGTNHDPRAWDEPDKFLPERFENGRVTPFNFIPQGGGDAQAGHRCPGESAAVALMKVAAKFLTAQMTYKVPEQKMGIDFTRLPAMVESGFVIQDVWTV